MRFDVIELTSKAWARRLCIAVVSFVYRGSIASLIWLSMALPSREATAALRLSHSDMDFGLVVLLDGVTEPQNVSITNTGDAPVLLEHFSVGCSCVRHDLPLPLRLAPGQEHRFKVWLDTSRADPVQRKVPGLIRGTSNRRFDQSAAIAVRYDGLKQVQLSTSSLELQSAGEEKEAFGSLVVSVVLPRDTPQGAPGSTPALQPMPPGLRVSLGSTKNREVNGHFIQRQFELTLDATDLGVMSRTFQLRVNPNVQGVKPIPFELVVIGDRHLRATPSTVDFGWIERQAAVFRDITLTATGNRPLLVAFVELGLPEDLKGRFHAVRLGNDAVRVIFEPHASLPHQAIAVEGELIIRLDHPDGPIARVPLRASVAPR